MNPKIIANQKIIASTFALAAMTMCGGAYAQSSAGTNSAKPAAAASQAQAGASSKGASSSGAASSAASGATVDTQKSSQMLASHIIGMTVKNGSGDKAEDIGKISDLVLDRDKKTVNVLIGVGGFLGIGTKEVGVPLKDVKFSSGSDTATITMTRDQLEKAPAYVTLSSKKEKQKQAAQQQKMKKQPMQPAPAAPAPAPAPQ